MSRKFISLYAALAVIALLVVGSTNALAQGFNPAGTTVGRQSNLTTTWYVNRGTVNGTGDVMANGGYGTALRTGNTGSIHNFGDVYGTVVVVGNSGGLPMNGDGASVLNYKGANVYGNLIIGADDAGQAGAGSYFMNYAGANVVGNVAVGRANPLNGGYADTSGAFGTGGWGAGADNIGNNPTAGNTNSGSGRVDNQGTITGDVYMNYFSPGTTARMSDGSNRMFNFGGGVVDGNVTINRGIFYNGADSKPEYAPTYGGTLVQNNYNYYKSTGVGNENDVYDGSVANPVKPQTANGSWVAMTGAGTITGDVMVNNTVAANLNVNGNNGKSVAAFYNNVGGVVEGTVTVKRDSTHVAASTELYNAGTINKLVYGKADVFQNTGTIGTLGFDGLGGVLNISADYGIDGWEFTGDKYANNYFGNVDAVDFSGAQVSFTVNNAAAAAADGAAFDLAGYFKAISADTGLFTFGGTGYDALAAAGYLYSGGGAFGIEGGANAAPEPATIALVSLGLAGLGFARARRRK